MRMFRRFKADQSGATALIFGLSLVPLLGLAGGALDYSRAAAIQTDMQRAVDMAAIALVRQPSSLTDGQLQAKGQQLFASAFQSGADVALDPVVVTHTGPTFKVTASGRVPNAVMQVFGLQETPVSADAVSVKGSQQIQLALVLDNTGSMRDNISGQRKIDALKANATKLLADLRDAATDADSVKISVVPFDTQVRLSANGYRNSFWLDWSHGVSKKNWTGYVFDRDQPYDVDATAPTRGRTATFYPAATSEWPGDLSAIAPLTSLTNYSDYQTLQSMIDNMSPRGNTDIAIGAAWGLTTLTNGPVFSQSTAASGNVKQYMVILTDGYNTENHVNGAKNNSLDGHGDPASKVAIIDARTQLACSAAKNAKIEVFTIKLLDGDDNLLGNCASPPNADTPQHYFDVKSAGQLTNAFQQITNAITGTRLTN